MASLTSAVAISFIVSKYKLILDRDEHTALLKALLVHPDAESQSCPDYEELLKGMGDAR